MAVYHFGHDPYERGEWHRETSYGACLWCGRVPQGNRRTYTYTRESDDRGCRGARSTSGRSFCNLACASAYGQV